MCKIRQKYTSNAGLKKLETIDEQFSKADIHHKRRLIGSMFPEKFQFEKNSVRTKDVHPILLKIASVNKGLNKKQKKDKSKLFDLSHMVLKAGLEPARPFRSLDFKSNVSTNSTTSALVFLKNRAKDGI